MHQKTSNTLGGNAIRGAIHRSKKPKLVKIHHHHRKPYRKRHLASLGVFILMALFFAIFIFTYQLQVSRSISGSKVAISSIFGNQTSEQNTIQSSLGFSLNYNTRQYYAGAVDAATGDIFVGDELSTIRPYEIIKISSQWSTGDNQSPSLDITYGRQYSTTDLLVIETSYVNQALNISAGTLKQVNSSVIYLDGHKFIKTSWQFTSNNPVVSKITTNYTTFVGIANNMVMTIKLNEGLSIDTSQAETIIQSIKFFTNSPVVLHLPQDLNSNKPNSLNLLDKFMFSRIAKATADQPANSAAEQISASYSPAIVKIYNFFCMDIYIEGTVYLTDMCNAVAGSGFVVSKDGYIATNGHVAQMSAKDLVIYHAFTKYVSGDQQPLIDLITLSGLTEKEMLGATTKSEAAAIIIDKLYQISDSTIIAKNDITNLLVGLSDRALNIEEVQKLTLQRKSYVQQKSIRQAKMIGYDYRMIDGIEKFNFSDVAILKIDNDNLPVVKLGSLSNLNQGSDLTILGFPGAATNNGLVESKQSKVSLTSGKVSSIKGSKGSEKKLIETDATIGHGNSGGPVFDNQAQVVGIATYTVDYSGEGGGVFNYIRDIRDLTDLATKKSITFNTKSLTQTEWEKALDLFNRARYSKSVGHFQKVKDLYPMHPTVNDFIATAQQKIDSGQDIKDLPTIWIIAGGLIITLGMAGSVYLIIRHKKAHELYKGEVMTGNMVPINKNMPPQYVSFNTPPVIQAPTAGQTNRTSLLPPTS